MSHLGLTGDLVSKGFVNSPSLTLPPIAHKACLTGSGHHDATPAVVLGGCPLSFHLQDPGFCTKTVPFLPSLQRPQPCQTAPKVSRDPLDLASLGAFESNARWVNLPHYQVQLSALEVNHHSPLIPFQCGSFCTLTLWAYFPRDFTSMMLISCWS